jgi:hypothetical protein
MRTAMLFALTALAALLLAPPASAGKSSISVGYSYRDCGSGFYFGYGYRSGYRHKGYGYGYGYHRRPFYRDVCYPRYHAPRTVYRTTYVVPRYRSSYTYRDYVASSPTYVIEPERRDYTYKARVEKVADREDVVVIEDEPRDETPVTFVSAAGAWEDLSQGQTGDALRAFAALVEAAPDDAVARLGYALTQAEHGQLNAAVTNMRRAIQQNVEVADDAPLDESTKLIIDGLIDDYMALLDRPSKRADACFMLAALLHLTDDHDLARRYADRAAEAGDKSAANAALRVQAVEESEE